MTSLTSLRRIACYALTVAALSTACQGASPGRTSTEPDPAPAGRTENGPKEATQTTPENTVASCGRESAVLANSAFVIASRPGPGAEVRSGFEVTGCSRTFEATVVWRLLARNGSELAAGHTSGGGVDGPGPFAFSVDYEIDQPQLGHLEIFEEDASGGEGFPPSRTVLPLVLE